MCAAITIISPITFLNDRNSMQQLQVKNQQQLLHEKKLLLTFHAVKLSKIQ